MNESTFFFARLLRTRFFSVGYMAEMKIVYLSRDDDDDDVIC